jgi:hypothetical protein
MRSPMLSPLLLIAGLCSARLCSAQVQLTPVVGVYNPGGGSFATSGFYDCNPGACGQGSSSASQQVAPLGGIRLTAWISRRLAVDVGFGYSPSGVATSSTYSGCAFNFPCGTHTSNAQASGSVTMGTAQLLVSLAPSSVGHSALFLAGGVGFLDRGGPGYNAAVQAVGTAAHSTVWGPSVGIGERLQVTSALAGRAEIEFVPITGAESDLLVSLGLSIAFPRSAISGVATH